MSLELKQKRRLLQRYVFVFVFVLLMPILIAFGGEASSTNFVITGDSFGSGNQVDSTNYLMTGSLTQSENVSYATDVLPLPLGNITSCGKIYASGTYTLTRDLPNITGPCFSVLADDVTISGAGYTVTGTNSNTSYAVISTSTVAHSGTSSAYTNLTIKNIKFNNFGKGLLGRGTDVPNGIGGNGTSVYIDHSTMGDIDVGGGDPTDKGGDGGEVNVETSIVGYITSNGGDSTACGIAGNGGNITITTDSVYASTTNEGGIISGCPGDPPTGGRRGIVVTNALSADTRALPPSVSNQPTASLRNNWSFENLYNFLLPVLRLKPINFPSMPSFSDTGIGKNTFSFISKMESFIFAPLPKDMSQSTVKLLNSLGVKYQKDLINLKKKPIVVKDAKGIPELFNVSISGIPTRLPNGEYSTDSQIPVTSYITYVSKTSVSQVVKVKSKTELNIYSDSKTNTTAVFDGKKVVFNNGKATISVPTKPGSYTLVTTDSKIPLVIEVIPAPAESATPKSNNTNLFIKTINWVSKLFKWW
ncbi:MAG: hypothetical protein WCJ74_00880 [bacterium]